MLETTNDQGNITVSAILLQIENFCQLGISISRFKRLPGEQSPQKTVFFSILTLAHKNVSIFMVNDVGHFECL